MRASSRSYRTNAKRCPVDEHAVRSGEQNDLGGGGRR